MCLKIMLVLLKSLLIINNHSYPIPFKNFQRKRFAFWSKEINEFLLSNDIVMKKVLKIRHNIIKNNEL